MEFVEPIQLYEEFCSKGWSTVICVRKYVTVYTKLLWTHRLQNQCSFRPSRLLQLLLQNKFSRGNCNKTQTAFSIPARARIDRLRARKNWPVTRAWPPFNRKRIPLFQNEWSLVHNIFKLVIICCSQFQKHTLGNQLQNKALRSLKAMSYLGTYTSLNAANVTLMFSLLCLLAPCVISVC